MAKRRTAQTDQGGPDAGDGSADTKASILEAAGEVFADKGFDRATGKEIAVRARINAAAVNYYYGGIEGLYAEVLAEAHRRLLVQEELLALAAGPGTAADKLRAIIEQLARAIVSPPSSIWPLRVLSREIMSPTSAAHVLRDRELRPKRQILTGLLGEILGLAPDHPAVARCFVNIIAPFVMVLLVGQRDAGRGPMALGSDPAATEDLITHFQCFALGGLSAVASKVNANRGGRLSTRAPRRPGKRRP
jgi:TetR/AcrR family transcriptional regulator, regulator of cefoperazone and chloramphenicol sensitivity